MECRSDGAPGVPARQTGARFSIHIQPQERAVYSACFVIFSSTPTHIKVTNSDDPP
jgi:hypothetical protein